MSDPTISIIVAMSRNRVIGRNGQLPWHLSNDLKRFKRLTMGHPIIMGRKTFDSIGRALPGRHSIVVSRQDSLPNAGENVDLVHTLEEALEHARSLDPEEIFIIGGGEIYRQALHGADRIYLTLVDSESEGDVFFPAIDDDAWRRVEQEHYSADERHDDDYTFITLERAG